MRSYDFLRFFNFKSEVSDPEKSFELLSIFRDRSFNLVTSASSQRYHCQIPSNHTKILRTHSSEVLACVNILFLETDDIVALSFNDLPQRYFTMSSMLL